MKFGKDKEEQCCGFSLAVRTLDFHSENDGHCYVAEFRDTNQKHPSNDQESGLRHLPTGLRSEAKHMKYDLPMSLQDTVKIIEDNYNIIINPKSMRQMLEYERTLIHPKELECAKLLEKLKGLSEEDPKTSFTFTCDSQGRLASIIWAFAEWIE